MSDVGVEFNSVDSYLVVLTFYSSSGDYARGFGSSEVPPCSSPLAGL